LNENGPLQGGGQNLFSLSVKFCSREKPKKPKCGQNVSSRYISSLYHSRAGRVGPRLVIFHHLTQEDAMEFSGDANLDRCMLIALAYVQRSVSHLISTSTAESY